VVLVAHDRWFLEAVGTAVLELEGGRSRFFPGPWHAWRKERAARELALGRAIERQEDEIARLERFVTRFRAGTRERQAQSRRQDDPDRYALRAPRAREGQAPPGPQRRDRLPLSARRGAPLERHGAGGVPARHRAHAEQGARAAGAVPVLRRGGGEARRGAVRRRAPPPVARDPRAVEREPAGPRRAHEPPRRRAPRGAPGRTACVPRDR